jgi:hypothetical protein
MTSADKYQDQVYHLSRRVEELEADLKMVREIGVEQQRAVNARQYQEKLLLIEQNTLLRQIVEEMKHEMQIAAKYLHDTYPNYEEGLPEIGMRMGFERCLASVEEKLRGLG